MNWKAFRRKCIRWENTTLKILGQVEMLFALVLLIPAAFALSFGEDVRPFLILTAPLFLIGFAQYMTCTESRTFRSVNGLLLVAMTWIIMFGICMVPYLLSGFKPIDALVESVSGITTTGLTVIGDLDLQPTSLLIWRSLTQWIGGITVVLIFLYFLPMVGYGRDLFHNELAGSGSSQYSQRASNAAKSFIFVYLLLSAFNFILLLVCGVSPLESMCLMLTTISTGGLTIVNSSLSTYSDAVQWITILFMFLGGTNFYLHYRAIYIREKGVYRGNSEFRIMVAWFIAISLVICLFMYQAANVNGIALDSQSIYQTFKNAIFTTVSLGTSTGFYVDDFTLWPSQCMILLMIVAMIGASTSSTSGGIKFSRIRIIYEYVKNGFRGTMHSNAVYTIKIDRKSVDDSIVRGALVVFMMYIATMIVAAVGFMAFGYNMVDSFGLSISAISNGGMGFGNFGPTGDFGSMDGGIKLFMVLLMWIGRLEVVTALILFTPGFWKDVWLNSRARHKAKHALDRYGLESQKR
ncbi:TrkH family potassium uptake protein [Candidatus Methanoprimaticola sp. MG2]|uniref:TrkH family potassium uptake protein n=1 Tax=Candidatus Methanoprimaticola sp. MG2 TaxID=3228838 RepID=UPI0039C60671